MQKRGTTPRRSETPQKATNPHNNPLAISPAGPGAEPELGPHGVYQHLPAPTSKSTSILASQRHLQRQWSRRNGGSKPVDLQSMRQEVPAQGPSLEASAAAYVHP